MIQVVVKLTTFIENVSLVRYPVFNGHQNNNVLFYSRVFIGPGIDTIGHAQGIGNKMIVLYTPCPFLWFLINFLRRKIVLWLFSDRCSDFSSSCCSL